MDVQKILSELRAERERVDAAIIALERIGASRGARRGRPPAWIVEARKAAAGKNKPAPKGPKTVGD